MHVRRVHRQVPETGIDDGLGFRIIIICHLALGGRLVKKSSNADDSSRGSDHGAVWLNTAFFVGSSDHVQTLLLGWGGSRSGAEVKFAILDNGVHVLLQTVVTHAGGPKLEVGGLPEGFPVNLTGHISTEERVIIG